MDKKLVNVERESAYTLPPRRLLLVFLHSGAGDIPAVKHSGTHDTQGAHTPSPGNIPSPGTLALNP